MEWLLYLLCPLMMLFCMKGMFFGGKKDCHTKQPKSSSEDMNALLLEIQNLKDQNTKLMKDMEVIKQKDQSNIISITKNSESSQKRTS